MAQNQSSPAEHFFIGELGGPGDATPPSNLPYLPYVDVPCVTHQTLDRICNDFRGSAPGVRGITTSDAYTETTAPCFHMDSPYIVDLQSRIESWKFTLESERSRYDAIVRDVCIAAAEKSALRSRVSELEEQLGEQEEKLEKLVSYKRFLLKTIAHQGENFEHEGTAMRAEDFRSAASALQDKILTRECDLRHISRKLLKFHALATHSGSTETGKS